jgi:hypothetical protein
MNTSTPNHAENEGEILVRYSRRGLWTLLFLFLLIGAAAAFSLAAPETHAFNRLAMSLPIIIVIAFVGLKASAKGARTNPSAPAMKALLNDELRQHSLKLAYRNGFFAVLLAQPMLALAPSWIDIAQPLPLMACLTLVTGVVVMTASLLYYDR